MIRRRKADVLTHLPPKTRETRFLSVPPLFKANSKLKVDLNEDENGNSVSYCTNVSLDIIATPDTGTLNLWRETSAVKTPKAIDYVEALLTSNDSEPLILFAHHKTMLDALEDLLIKRRVGYIRIDGQVDSASRQQFATQFQDDPLCRVALLSITAAGVGLTLTRACLVLFVELYWNPGILMQAEDRAHRIGQVNPVTVRYLLAKNTIDDYIWPMLIKKLQILEQIGLSTSGPDKTSEFQPLPVTCVGSGNERQTLTTSFFPASNTAKQSEVDQFDSAFDAIDDMQLEAIMSTVEQKYK